MSPREQDLTLPAIFECHRTRYGPAVKRRRFVDVSYRVLVLSIVIFCYFQGSGASRLPTSRSLL